MSALADSQVDSTQLSPPTTSTVFSQQTLVNKPDCSRNNSHQFSELAGIKKTSKEHYSFVELQSKVRAFSEDKLNQVTSGGHDSLLREIFVTEPDFYLVTEFNPPDPALKTIVDTRFPKTEVPWYQAQSKQYKLKLAGWQDSNSLYRAKLRFFL